MDVAVFQTALNTSPSVSVKLSPAHIYIYLIHLYIYTPNTYTYIVEVVNIFMSLYPSV